MSQHHERDARRAFSPLFVVTGAVLAVAAVGLKPTVDRLVRDYSKLPIGISRPLATFDAGRIGSFRVVTEDPLFPDVVSPTVDAQDALQLVFEERGQEGRRELDTLLFVTYYSDPRDTVPHTPEVCYRQGGASVTGISKVSVEVPGLGPERSPVKARFLDMEREGWRQVLVYVFHCNGRLYDSRWRVRLAIGLPGDRHVYCSKIEVMTSVPPGSTVEEAKERCLRLLAESLPVLEDHFPTPGDVRRA